MLSVGTIVISKLTKRFEAKEGDSEQQKMAKKVALDSSVAAVNSFTKASKSGGNSNNKGNQLGKDEGSRISSMVGAPKKESIDRSGSAYQALFKDSSGNTRSDEERSIIKSMASAGYSIDQIQQYLDATYASGYLKINHSGVNMYTYSTFYPDELYHHGIKGMKWGVRRFQNPDGSLKHPKKSIGQRISDHHHWAKNARRMRDEREALVSYHVANRHSRPSNSYKTSFQLANEDIAKKYGDKAIKDIDKLEREDGVAIIGSCLAAIGTVGVLAALNWK